MEKKTNQASAKEAKKVTHNVEYVKLQDYGYEKSGNTKGDPDVYASYLDRILNGDLVDENYKGITDAEKNQKKEKIKQLEKELEEAKKANEKTENEISGKEKKIDEYRQVLLKIHEDKEKDPELLHRKSFSPFKFSINLFLLTALSVYLFFFYISAAYKALYIDLEKIATDIAEGIGTGSIMPSPYELLEAMQYNYLLFLIPFVFYAFGWAFHIILDMKQKYKYVLLGLLILLTFFVDFLLAFNIHDNTEQAKLMMGLPTKSWSGSPTFYTILSFGFLVYILWSIMLDSLLREWRKRLENTNLKKIIKHHRNDIETLSNKLVPTEGIIAEINQLRDDIATVMIGNLKRYIDQFTTGWVSYLTPDNLKDVKTKCLNIKRDFEDKHNIKTSVVKVTHKRGV